MVPSLELAVGVLATPSVALEGAIGVLGEPLANCRGAGTLAQAPEIGNR